MEILLIKRILVKVCMLLMLPLVISGCGQNQYSGDGTLDTGLLIYPRFRVTFADVQIKNAASKVYTFKGAPRNDLVLRLEILMDNNIRELSSDKLSKLWDELNNSQVRMRISLENDNSKIISLGPESLIHSWTLAALGKEYYFWNQQFSNMQLETDKEYSLYVDIFTSKEMTHKIKLVPVLEGGGFGGGEIIRAKVKHK